MRRLELQSGLWERVFGPRVVGHEEHAAADRLQRTLHRVEPDPLFRRRLRGSVVNYYVASREGHLRRGRRPRRRMGTLGRSVLYASVMLALGVSAVGAASQESLPGDALYGVKLRLEEIRMQIAPDSVRGELAELVLAERTKELQRLAEAGEWGLVTAAARRLASAEATLLAIEPSAIEASATDHARDVLEAVLARAPEAALPGLQRALQAVATNAANPNAPGQATDRGAGSPPTGPGQNNGQKADATPPQANGPH